MDAAELAAIRACQAGALDQFDVLYRQHVDAIYRFLHRRTLVREVAEDLTSTTFLKAMESIGSYNPDRAPLIAWLYRIARNTLIDHARSPASKTVTLDDTFEIAGDDDATLKATRAIDKKRLMAALQKLTPVQRDIVTLRLWEGLSYQEISSVVGKSEGNCKVLFSRSVAALRSALILLLLFLLSPRSL